MPCKSSEVLHEDKTGIKKYESLFAEKPYFVALKSYLWACYQLENNQKPMLFGFFNSNLIYMPTFEIVQLQNRNGKCHMGKYFSIKNVNPLKAWHEITVWKNYFNWLNF